VVNDYHMGYTAELVSEKYAVTRDDMDRWSYDSNVKALSRRNREVQEEILPVTVLEKRRPIIVDKDEDLES